MAIADNAAALGKRPASMQPDEAVVYDFCIELHETMQVSDTTFARAKAIFSEKRILDLIATCGFYVLISMVLNVAQAGIPSDGELPLA